MSDAVKYLQKNGLKASKELAEMGFGFCSVEGGLSFHTEQLKQLVESHELVEIHGYEKSKEIVANAPSDDCCFSWKIGEFYDKTVNIGELKKAITDVESCMDVSHE